VFRRAAAAAVAWAISAAGVVEGGGVASRGVCVACVVGYFSVSRFVAISQTDVIVFLSHVTGIVVAEGIGASGRIAAVISRGIVGIIASIPRVLPTNCPIVSLVAG